MSFVPYFHLLKKHRVAILLGAISFWFILGVLVYFSELVASSYFGASVMDSIEQKQYLLRWVSWLLLTPLIVFFALKINIGNTRIGWFVLLHLLIGTLILSLEFGIEYSILTPLAEAYYQRRVLIAELIIPFLNKYFGYIIIYFLMVGIVNLFVYMQSLYSTKQSLMETELQNKNLKYELALAQIQSLKMQIQPHFLFNIHQSLLSLIIQQENTKAAQVLTKLSELLRYTVAKQTQEFISLQEESNLTGLYLSLQHIRFAERMSWSIDIDPQTASIAVPFFILQPLAENAVKYGIEQTDHHTHIHLCSKIAQQYLVIQLTNTGTLQTTPIQHGLGIGLSNVVSRLQRYYSDKATLELYEDQQQIIAQINIPLS